MSDLTTSHIFVARSKKASECRRTTTGKSTIKILHFYILGISEIKRWKEIPSREAEKIGGVYMGNFEKMLRYGIIGCGVIAPFHADAVTKLERGCLRAVCDIVPETANNFAARYGVEKVYYDYREMLKDDEIDAICICTPSGLHGEMCIAAATSGKHIVCEKPMEITNEKNDAIISAIEKYRVKMQCIFQRRTMPAAIAARKAIREGKLGRVLLASAYLKYYRDQAYYNSASWRGTWELDGGGALMNQGVHGIDLLQWMVGEKVVSVFGKAENLARDIEVEDTAVAFLRFEGGGYGVIEGATVAYPGFDTKFELHGEYGSIIFSDAGVEAWDFIGEKIEKPEDGPSVGGSKSNTGITPHLHYLLIKDLTDAVLDDCDVMIPPSEGRKAVEIITAIYRSQRENREIKLGDE